MSYFPHYKLFFKMSLKIHLIQINQFKFRQEWLLNICKCTSIKLYKYIHIYIYIEREKERGGER